MCGMSEGTITCSEMEALAMHCDKSEKSGLNFSISRLLSAGAERFNQESNNKNNKQGKNNNNNNVINNKNHHQHKHTIHHRATRQDSTELEKHVITRHGDEEVVQGGGGGGDSDCSDETDNPTVPPHENDSDSEIEMDDPEEERSKEGDKVGNRSSSTPQSRGDSNRSSPESHSQSNYHHHLSQESHLASSPAIYNPSAMEALGGGMNPFPMLGYSSIFLPNFPCPLTSSPNHIIRVPAHRPMSNFQLFGQSGLGPHNMDMNSASPLFSTFDPRSSLLLKDRLNGKSLLLLISLSIASIKYE
jgi:hypothetical protein